MIENRINNLRKNFDKFKIDGYVIPKNDEFFSEYANNDRLKKISNFSGSAGIAIILKKKNYLFVDGRYTLQALKECGENFQITEIHKKHPSKIIKGLTLGLNPKLFTTNQLKYYFSNKTKFNFINIDLIDQIYKNKIYKSKPFFSLKKTIIGESHESKIQKALIF